MTAIENRAYFIKMCDEVKINLKKAVVITFIFVVEQSDHDLILKRFFVRASQMQNTNMNDESLKMMIYSDDDTKKNFFFAISAQHSRNKDADFIFQRMKFLN